MMPCLGLLVALLVLLGATPAAAADAIFANVSPQQRRVVAEWAPADTAEWAEKDAGLSPDVAALFVSQNINGLMLLELESEDLEELGLSSGVDRKRVTAAARRGSFSTARSAPAGKRLPAMAGALRAVGAPTAAQRAETQFRWADAPLRSWHYPVFGGLAYLASVSALLGYKEALQPGRAPVSQQAALKCVTVVHNAVLCLGSAAMFYGCFVTVQQRRLLSGQWEWLFCEAPGTATDGALYFWSYVYYLSKYYEFLDTWLLVYRTGRRPIFLHIVHHTTVPLMAWLWMDTAQSLQFLGLLFNTFVHVVMYCYYGLTAVGIRPRWAPLITALQVLQFMTSMALLCVTAMWYLVPNGWGSCAGTAALCFNTAFNLLLLVKFAEILVAQMKPRTRQPPRPKRN